MLLQQRNTENSPIPQSEQITDNVGPPTSNQPPAQKLPRQPFDIDADSHPLNFSLAVRRRTINCTKAGNRLFSSVFYPVYGN